MGFCGIFLDKCCANRIISRSVIYQTSWIFPLQSIDFLLYRTFAHKLGGQLYRYKTLTPFKCLRERVSPLEAKALV